MESGLLNGLALLLAAEFGLVVLADLLGRLVSLIDNRLYERLANDSSVLLMKHAEDLEPAEHALGAA